VDYLKTKFTNRDFHWLTGILIGIVILVCSIRLSDNSNVVNIFSFMGSGISIALAFVAIGMSIKQELSSNLVNSDTRKTLISLNEKIIGLGVQVGNLDTEGLANIMSSSLSSLQDNVIKIINEKVNGYGVEEKSAIKEAVSQEVNKVNQETKKQIGNYVGSNISSTLNEFSSNMAKLKSSYSDKEWENITTAAANPSFKFDIMLESIKKSINEVSNKK